MNGCIFCAIVSGEEPASLVYEGRHVIAIMDIAPATRGHALVLPRAHRSDLTDISAEEAHHVLDGALEVVRLMRAGLNPAGINLVHATGAAAWQTGFHFHIHVIPRYDAGELTLPWPFDQPRADRTALEEVATRIRGD